MPLLLIPLVTEPFFICFRGFNLKNFHALKANLYFMLLNQGHSVTEMMIHGTFFHLSFFQARQYPNTTMTILSPDTIWNSSKMYVQNTLRVVHSPVVEKLPVVDKTLPPNHFYLVKVPSSGQFPVVDKKSWDSVTFCCSHFYENLLFPCIYIFATQIHNSVYEVEWS